MAPQSGKPIKRFQCSTLQATALGTVLVTLQVGALLYTKDRSWTRALACAPTVNATLTLAKDAEVLKCCWNRHEQICAATGDCDGGGEGCVENGTGTHDHGVVRCFGAWELSAALQRLQRVDTRRAAALSVAKRELTASRAHYKRSKALQALVSASDAASQFTIPMFTLLGKGSCCHSAEGCSTTQMEQEVLYGTRLFCQVRQRACTQYALCMYFCACCQYTEPLCQSLFCQSLFCHFCQVRHMTVFSAEGGRASPCVARAKASRSTSPRSRVCRRNARKCPRARATTPTARRAACGLAHLSPPPRSRR